MKAGWNWLINSTKWHWFDEDGRSLCKNFMVLSNESAEIGNDESKDNCKACIKLKYAKFPEFKP